MKVDIKNPQTEADYVFITMLLWYDIYKNCYETKEQSKYFHLVKGLEADCGLCHFHHHKRMYDEGNYDIPCYLCKNCILVSTDTHTSNSFISKNLINIIGWKCPLWFNWFSCDYDLGWVSAKEIYERCRDRFYDLRDLNDYGRLSYDNRGVINNAKRKRGK